MKSSEEENLSPNRSINKRTYHINCNKRKEKQEKNEENQDKNEENNEKYLIVKDQYQNKAKINQINQIQEFNLENVMKSLNSKSTCSTKYSQKHYQFAMEYFCSSFRNETDSESEENERKFNFNIKLDDLNDSIASLEQEIEVLSLGKLRCLKSIDRLLCDIKKEKDKEEYEKIGFIDNKSLKKRIIL